MIAISNFAPRGAIYVTTARNTVHEAAYTNADGDPMSVRLETFEHDTPDLVLSTTDGRTETTDRVSADVIVALLRAAGYRVETPEESSAVKALLLEAASALEIGPGQNQPTFKRDLPERLRKAVVP